MYHTEMNPGESLDVGNGMTVTVGRKQADGSAVMTVTAQPGAAFTFTSPTEQAKVTISDKEGSRTKLSVQADRSVPIRKNV